MHFNVSRVPMSPCPRGIDTYQLDSEQILCLKVTVVVRNCSQ